MDFIEKEIFLLFEPPEFMVSDNAIFSTSGTVQNFIETVGTRQMIVLLYALLPNERQSGS